MTKIAAATTSASRTDPSVLRLRIEGFAALLGEGPQEPLGSVGAEDVAPKAMRRRLSPFDVGAARCILGLARPGVEEDIVFASRYGNMSVTVDLLHQLAEQDLLSPAKFSMSVHNAAAGAASQIAANRAGHTAIAAGVRTLTAGLTEVWCRLKSGRPSVLFVFADLPLCAPYEAFDEPGPGVHLAVRASLGEGEAYEIVEEGRIGAASFARALAQGAGGATWKL